MNFTPENPLWLIFMQIRLNQKKFLSIIEIYFHYERTFITFVKN
jgi:hypothetical protein